MLAKQLEQNPFTTAFLKISWILLLMLFALTLGVHAQNNSAASKKLQLPLLQDYKGVKIGMTADDVRAKLGKPQSEDKDGFLYNFAETETTQVLLDAAQKVRCISIMYTGEHLKPPTIQDIFGPGAAADSTAGGGMTKLVKYTEAGYWISYNRMPGEKPMTMVVIQKL